jgi:hypothetical protein
LSESLTFSQFSKKLQENGIHVSEQVLHRRVIEILEVLDLDIEAWFNIYRNTLSLKVKSIARRKINDQLPLLKQEVHSP